MPLTVRRKFKLTACGRRLLSRSLFVGLWAALLWAAPAAAQSDPVETLLQSLTLEQRAAQLFLVRLSGSSLNSVGREFLARWQPGGLALLGDNISTPEGITRLTNAYQQTIVEAGGIPLLIAVDQEGGPISHLREGFTVFPTPALLTAAGDPTLAARVGGAIAEELRAVGINMNLAPVADLETQPANRLIRRRAFGSDPAMTAPIISGFIRGTQAVGVLATAKHFPGHGETTTDSHAALPVIDLPYERLDAVELVPFRAAIAGGTAAIMVAHIWYPALEPQPELPASLSGRIMTDLLRRQLGYDGLIATDALDMDAVDRTYSYPQAVLMAIQAGADLLVSAHIGPDSHAAAIQAVADAVRSGQLSAARLDESVRRILRAKQAYHILDWQPLDPGQAAARLNSAAHERLLDELFLAGVTVAVDRQGWVPLPPERSAAIVYPATRTQINRECSLRPGLRWVGVSDSPSEEEIGWAKDAARRTEVTVVFTQNAESNPQQQALVRALPPERTVVVALWSPYDWLAFPDIAAYLTTYSPARAAVPAVCAVLFGQAPAQGRLSITLSDELPAGSRS